MSLFDQFTSDLAEVIGDFGKPVVWNGQTLAALVAEPELGQSLGIGGFTDEVRFTAKFLPPPSLNASPALVKPSPSPVRLTLFKRGLAEYCHI